MQKYSEMSKEQLQALKKELDHACQPPLPFYLQKIFSNQSDKVRIKTNFIKINCLHVQIHIVLLAEFQTITYTK